MKWLKLELELQPELAEPVAELLSRHVPGGVALSQRAELPAGPPAGLVSVQAFLPVDSGLQGRRRAIAEGLWHLGQIQAIPDPSFEYVQDSDWANTWKEHHHPLEVGDRLLIRPSWAQIRTSGRLVVSLDPGMAFGTGSHPSTRLALHLLERWMRPGQMLIDLGCGSGILALCAARLGAGEVLGLDIDSDAVEIARRNALNNGLHGTVEFRQGSLAQALALASARAPADLVVANILAPVLADMISAGLANAIAQGGLLILSGILDEQADGLESLAEAHGLTRLDAMAEADWVGLVFKHEPPRQDGAVSSG